MQEQDLAAGFARFLQPDMPHAFFTFSEVRAPRLPLCMTGGRTQQTIPPTCGLLLGTVIARLGSRGSTQMTLRQSADSWDAADAYEAFMGRWSRRFATDHATENDQRSWCGVWQPGCFKKGLRPRSGRHSAGATAVDKRPLRVCGAMAFPSLRGCGWNGTRGDGQRR